MGEVLYGAGNREGKHLPKGIIVIICIGFFFEVMQINGIYQSRANLLKISSSLLLYSLAFQMITGLVCRMAGLNLEPIFKAYAMAIHFYETEQKNDAYWPILTSVLDNAIRAVKVYSNRLRTFSHPGCH
jgi:hypothetical protein